MRRFLPRKRFPWPWLRRDATPNETSPLLPKAGSTNNAEELALVTTDFQAGTNSGQQHNSPTDARIDPCYGYSFMDYFLKYFLIICNLLFTVLGLLLLALGVWGLISKESFAQEKISSIGTDPMLVVLSVGFLLTVLCLSGCVGALRENRCLLKLFSATVLVLITAQVIIAIVAHTLQDQIEGNLRSGMLVAIARYQDDLDLRFITDEIQSNLQCCGADNYRDWEINIYYNCSAPGVLACGVPATCCVDPLENGTVWNSHVIFLGGCLGEISRWIKQHEGLIGIIVTVVFGVQILILFITIRLLERINRHKV
uniref:Tetraspanin n=1 Tax=Astatotilapia calliptera TaxID=8154 RepID=A0A3P8R501_ASTCA